MITVCKDCSKRHPGCHGTVSGIRLSVRHWTWKMHAGGLKTQQDLMQADTGNIGEKENEGKCIRHSI